VNVDPGSTAAIQAAIASEHDEVRMREHARLRSTLSGCSIASISVSDLKPSRSRRGLEMTIRSVLSILSLTPLIMTICHSKMANVNYVLLVWGRPLLDTCHHWSKICHFLNTGLPSGTEAVRTKTICLPDAFEK
jgi:hypothetical protein